MNKLPDIDKLEFNNDSIMTMLINGYNQSQIAKHFHKHPTNISNRLKELGIKKSEVKIDSIIQDKKRELLELKENLTNKLWQTADKHVNSANEPDKIKALSAQQNMVAAGISIEKARLLEDKPTAIFDYGASNQSLIQINQQINVLEQRLADRGIDIDTLEEIGDSE